MEGGEKKKGGGGWGNSGANGCCASQDLPLDALPTTGGGGAVKMQDVLDAKLSDGDLEQLGAVGQKDKRVLMHELSAFRRAAARRRRSNFVEFVSRPKSEKKERKEEETFW